MTINQTRPNKTIQKKLGHDKKRKLNSDERADGETVAKKKEATLYTCIKEIEETEKLHTSAKFVK